MFPKQWQVLDQTAYIWPDLRENTIRSATTNTRAFHSIETQRPSYNMNVEAQIKSINVFIVPFGKRVQVQVSVVLVRVYVLYEHNV